jgi:hypothetical protein
VPPFDDLKYLAQGLRLAARDRVVCQVHVTAADPDLLTPAWGAASALGGIEVFAF